MSVFASRKRLVSRCVALVAAALCAAMLAPVAASAMPPSPALIQRSKTDASLKLSIDQYVSGVKPAGLDEPSAPLDLAGLRTSYLSTAPSASKLAAGIYDVAVGGYRQLVLLVDFSDKPGIVAPSFFDDLMFKNTVGPSSVRGFYREISAGALDILPVAADLPSVRGWLRMPQPYSYYCPLGSKGQGAYPNNAQKLAEDAMAAAKASGADFSSYDNNHDGTVDGVVIVHSGKGQEASGNAADIWSHKWNVARSAQYNGVWTGVYTMEPEYWTNPGDMTTGVFCHELGHAFGLPDLYDTDYSSRGVGNWSLMAGGSWNGTNGNSPARPDAFCMVKLGFATATQISSASAAVTIRSANASSTGDVYRVEKAGVTGGKQYFLIENRQRTGTDSALPGAGLLIWHIDTSVYNNDNEAHYEVDLEEAHGGTQHLSANTGNGDAGDPFPGTAGRRTFSDLTDPSSKYYDGSGGVMVTNISASSSAMSALIARDRATLDLTAPVTSSDVRTSYDTSALISLVATDSGSGVASTTWSLDGIAGTGPTVTTSAYGTHTLVFRSTDVAGNVETSHAATFAVRDVTAPVATSDAVTSYTGTAAVRVTASDDVSGSGVASVALSMDAQPAVTIAGSVGASTCASVGTHTLSFSAVDKAGNRSATSTVTFTISTPLPAAPSPVADAGEVSGDTVRISWSPVANAASYELELNGRAFGSASSGSAVLSGLADGANVIRVRALNQSGDAGAWSRALTVVRTVPVAVAATTTVSVTGSGSSSMVTVLVADSSGIGMAGTHVALQCSVDAVSWSDLATLTTDASGIATYAYKQLTGTWLRSMVVGNAPGVGSASIAVRVFAAPDLAKPLAMTSVKHGRAFTISGYLRPKHAAGRHDVSVKLYRLVGGRWKYYKTLATTNVDCSTYTKYSVRTSVPTAGSWRVYACYAASADFAATTSGYTQFKAR